MCSVQEIDESIADFEKVVKAAVEYSVLKEQSVTKCDNKLPVFITNMIKARNIKSRLWVRTRQIEHKLE